MTKNEAIKELNERIELIKKDYREEAKEYKEVLEMAAASLSEIHKYQSIGTVEECREARERQRGKKPIMKPFYEDMEEEYLCCPTCGDILTDRIPMDNKDFYFHCLNCGQKLDWSDTPRPTK